MIIRFSCRKCGKSLRADASIAGRKSRCTNCAAINRVPQESTRKSGEKPERVALRSSTAIDDEQDLFGDEVVTLIADSDSDSFEGFENLDFSGLKLPTSTPTGHSNRPDPNPRSSWSSTRPLSFETPPPTVDQKMWVDKSPLPSNPANSWRPTKPTLSPSLLIFVGAVFLLSAISAMAYLGYRFLLTGAPVVVKTELERSAIGFAHSKSLFQFKKTARVLSNLERGYLQKKLPEAGLSDVRAVKLKAEALIEEDAKKIKEANDVYSADNKEEAQAILQMQIDIMQPLQKEVEFQVKWLERKVFPK